VVNLLLHRLRVLGRTVALEKLHHLLNFLIGDKRPLRAH
jgi:hypothetical protein